MRRFLCIAALMGVGCATATKSHEVSVSGSHPFTPTDVRQVEELVAARSDIPKPLRSIHTDRRDHARVATGDLTRRVGSGSLFTVAKRHGRWIIDSPVEEEHIIYP